LPSFRRHVLRDWRIIHALVEKLIHLGKLFVILKEHIFVLLVQKLFDFASCFDILEFGEEIEGSLRRSQLVSESTVDKTNNV